MSPPRRRLLIGLPLALVALIALVAMLLPGPGRSLPRESARRLRLEVDGRMLWQALVTYEQDHGAGGRDLDLLVAAQYIDPEVAAQFRAGAGTRVFVARDPMPAVPEGAPWGGPGEVAAHAIPESRLIVHADGRLEWMPVDRFDAEIAPTLPTAP